MENITKEEAIRIAVENNKLSQVDFFISSLGMPPIEALIKAEIITDASPFN